MGVFPGLCQFVDEGRLVDVGVAVLAKPLEILQSNRILSNKRLSFGI